MASSSQKPTMMSDDSASETLRSATPSLNEKAGEAADSVREGSQSPIPHPEHNKGRASTDNGLGKVHSTTKEAQDELTRVMTSGEGIEYPTGMKLTLISLALCLSVFLMALVCAILICSQIYALTRMAIGQHHYCHGYPQDHRSVPLPARRWMVWLGIFAHHGLVPTSLWQILYLLLYQICLSHRNWYFRAGKFDMWHCTKLDRVDSWSCDCWTWISWYLLRCSHSKYSGSNAPPFVPISGLCR